MLDVVWLDYVACYAQNRTYYPLLKYYTRLIGFSKHDKMIIRMENSQSLHKDPRKDKLQHGIIPSNGLVMQWNYKLPS